MHSLIHCNDGVSIRPDVESVNDDNGDELQDISDYVREELQEELNLKGGDFLFGTSSSECYEVRQNVGVDDVEINHMLNDQPLVLIKQKGERSKEMNSGVTVEGYNQKAEQIDMSIVSNSETHNGWYSLIGLCFSDWHKHRNFG